MTQPIILFDLGGVLVDLAEPATAMQLAISNDEFWQIWMRSELVQAYETGQLSTAEFSKRFAPQLGFADVAAFDAAIRRWHLPLFPGAEQGLAALTADHPVALLSNTNDLHWQHVAAQSSVFDGFEQLFLSYETGNAKPSAAAFADVVTHFDCAPAEILFLDDTARNVVAARDFGLQALQVRGWDEALAAVTDRL